MFGFSLIGLLVIHVFHDKTPIQFFSEGVTLNTQLLRGVAFGAAASLSAIFIIQLPWFSDSMDFFTELIKELSPGKRHILFYSLCAGIGEEILFRGAIQPFLGIWITSVIFIFIHGYLNPFNRALMIYGLFMVIVSAGLGYLYDLLGIYAAMTAHFLFDVIMFSFLKYRATNQS